MRWETPLQPHHYVALELHEIGWKAWERQSEQNIAEIAELARVGGNLLSCWISIFSCIKLLSKGFSIAALSHVNGHASTILEICYKSHMVRHGVCHVCFCLVRWPPIVGQFLFFFFFSLFLFSSRRVYGQLWILSQAQKVKTSNVPDK